MSDRPCRIPEETAASLPRGGTSARFAAIRPTGYCAHVSRILAKLGMDNRVRIALLVHDAEPVTGESGAPRGVIG